MDQFYVTPDGQIAQLPKRSFMDRLTSGLYDASVEWRKPGGAQESRLARNQPLTSALNQYGAQKRGFDQEGAILDKRLGFDAGQSEIERNLKAKLAADELAARKAEADARLGQGERHFNATHGLAVRQADDAQIDRNMRDWNTAKTFMVEMPRVQSQIKMDEARAAEALALAEYNKARVTSALRDAQRISPNTAQIIKTLRPEFKDVPVEVFMDMTYDDIKALGIRPPGTSGTMASPWGVGGIGSSSALPASPEPESIQLVKPQLVKP